MGIARTLGDTAKKRRIPDLGEKALMVLFYLFNYLL
jgi:hypothetical protein